MDGEFRMRRWAIAALVVVAAIAIGATAYQAGVSHGIAMQPPAAIAPGAAGGAQAVPPAPYPYTRIAITVRGDLASSVRC